MEVLQRTANRGSIATGAAYEIDNSLKLEEANLECINTPSSYSLITASNVYKGTTSFWIKRTSLNNGSGVQWLFNGSNSSRYDGIYWDANDKLKGYFSALGNGADFVTTQVFRDTSAWYHIVMAIDTSLSTASERIKIYVNGEQITAWDTSPSIDQNTQLTSLGTDAYHGWGTSYSYNLGASSDGSSEYLANCIHIDGQQLTSTDFGEFDEDSGIWKPKAYTGTYGNKGYLLEFQSSSALGTDTSGNGNNFTNNRNITAANQATDTPTNNGCTLNVLASLEGSNDITEGALVSTGKAGGGGNFNGTYGTIGIDPFNSSVDWYWEIETSIGTSGSDTDIGIGWIKESRITSGSTAYNNVYADGISRYSSQTANAAGDIWGVLLETGTTPVMKLYRNDGLIYTATHGSGGVSFDTLMFPYITVKGTSVDARLNFLNPASSFSIASGNTDPNGYGNFEFDPKGGYALCTKNLAEFG